MFITLEDEGDIANLIIWPSLFEKHRLTILGGQMLSCRGGVIHVVAEHVSDHANLLRQVGGLNEPFTVPTGRGDEAKHAGGPDPRESAQLRSTARHTNALCEFQIEKERVNVDDPEMGAHHVRDLARGSPVRIYRAVGSECRVARILFYVFIVIFVVLLVLGLTVFRAARGP
jgi:hypothetical protein